MIKHLSRFSSSNANCKLLKWYCSFVISFYKLLLALLRKFEIGSHHQIPETHPSRTFMTVTLFRRVAWNTNRRKKYLPAAVQDWRKDLLRKLRRIFDTTIEDTQFTFCWYGLRFDIFAYLVFHEFLAYIYFRLPACTKRLPPQLMPEANLLWLVAYLCHLVNFLVVYWNTYKYKKTLHHVGSVISAFWHCNS